MTIYLRKNECLPKMRAAFQANELQSQARRYQHPGCYYAGPCVIGVCLTPEQQISMDTVLQYPSRASGTGLNHLISAGLIATDDNAFFLKAQDLHDQANNPKRAQEPDLDQLAAHLGLTS